MVHNLVKTGFDPENIATEGNRFLCSNGYMGLRGVPEECGPAFFPAVTLAGVYDRNGDKWREPVNAPHGLTIRVSLNGRNLALGNEEPLSHRVEIDYDQGLYKRSTDFGPLSLQSCRYASMAEPHLLADQFGIEIREPGQLEIKVGISTEIWDINGPHLFDFHFEAGDVLLAEGISGEKKITVSTAQSVRTSVDMESSVITGADGVFRVFRRSVEPGEKISLSVFAAIYTSQDPADCGSSAKALCSAALKKGPEDCLNAHLDAWSRIHTLSEILLEGNEEADLALHASQYHLNSIAPRHAASMSIPARGLSGQTYKGAIFWDSEIFFFPMFVHTQPEIARSLLRYRIDTLPGALKKAAEYGYRGAFYAWESQEGGEEGCTNFNVVDVFTHRPVRTYFRDKQIHISGDIVYALRNYYEITGDRTLLEDGGAKVILECARFYLSRATLHADTEQVDYPDVIGPDEYHERVTNNAFTNRVIRHTMETALWLEEVFADRPEFFEELLAELNYDKDLKLIREISPRIRKPLEKNGIIEQFDGYFELENCSLETVRGRLADPREYWGGDHGVAGTTRVIKQADVIAMMALFPGDFTDETVAANWNFYEPRTEHGSSLSACMYALTACRLGRPEDAWDLFMRTAAIDVNGHGKEWAGEIYIGGTHPASNGGAWMIAALGFAGLSMKNGRPECHPHLPKQITRLSFPITAGGKAMRVTVTHDGAIIEPAC